MNTLPLLVFDVNETLLDLDSLVPRFERIFGDGRAARDWFAQVILYSEALTLAGEYADFGELGGAVVKMLGLIRGRAISGEDMAALKQAVASMPPHPEVAAALQKLKEAGFRMVTLTNNPEKTVIEQLKQAELSRFFERSFSIDDHVRRYKPAPESYGAVATALGVQLSQCCMVACHAWDILGAAAVGMETALLLRPGNAVISVGPQPTITGSDLGVVADALIACHVH